MGFPSSVVQRNAPQGTVAHGRASQSISVRAQSFTDGFSIKRSALQGTAAHRKAQQSNDIRSAS